MKFVTFLNSGCIEICKNMLASAKNVGLDTSEFYIACLDRITYDEFKQYKNCFLHKEIKLKKYQNWSFDKNSGFREVVRNKWRVIQNIYEKDSRLCWVDVDIVFKSNPLQYISNDSKVLFQGDDPGNILCSGFMVFNELQECRDMIGECASDLWADDQLIVNKIALEKYPHIIRVLDRDLFPNGYAYYSENRKEKAIIVHNNFMIGIDTKIAKFKTEGLWYL